QARYLRRDPLAQQSLKRTRSPRLDVSCRQLSLRLHGRPLALWLRNRHSFLRHAVCHSDFQCETTRCGRGKRLWYARCRNGHRRPDLVVRYVWCDPRFGLEGCQKTERLAIFSRWLCHLLVLLFLAFTGHFWWHGILRGLPPECVFLAASRRLVPDS